METRWDIKVPPFTDGQKKLIEMTEKLAEKRGGKICDVDDDITDIKELLDDTIKRIEEPTNYDWLRSLNMEQLAEWLFETFDLCGAGCSNCFVKKLCFVDNDKMPTEMFEEWLKQPHTKE